MIGSDEPLIWGVWVSLSRDNFERELHLSNRPERVKEPPYFVWHSSRIPVYPDTLLLKTRLHSRDVGMRPYIEVEPTDHPLAAEQRNGITEERLAKIAEQMEHHWLHPEWDKGGYYADPS